MSTTKGMWPLALVLSALLGAACSGLGAILPHYTGPRPAQDPISAERVVVRRTIPRVGSPEVGGFYADRLRFVDAGQPHDVNRVVNVDAGDLLPQLSALGIQVGDTLRISTRYFGTYTEGLPRGTVPGWPGHDSIEYPMGYHTLTAVARAR
ncbi:MAG TPA: hypothetical protein VE913_13840 [Longimicrobium sp.]|nr:hypothetical protein [Longimicrobium sp.]